MPTVVLRRRLFGFSPQRVHELLADRDYAMGRALERAESMERELGETRGRLKTAEGKVQEMEGRARSAEDRLRKVEADLAASRRELNGRSEELASLRKEVTELRQGVQDAEQLATNGQGAEGARPLQLSDPIMGLLVQGLTPIIDTARASAAAMIEEAAKISEQRVGEAEGALRLLQEQGQSMASWWNGVRGVLDPMLSTLDHARSRMDEIPKRVEQALAPLTDLMGSVKGQLGELARISDPPPFQSPVTVEGKVVDLTSSEDGQADGVPAQTSQEVGATTGAGLPGGSHPWWPDV